jgi:hypothetical protein
MAHKRSRGYADELMRSITRPFRRPRRRTARRPWLESVVYDASTHTVSLTPDHRLKPNGYYRLTVNGASAGGLAGLSRSKLDGSGNGKAGSNFTALIHGFGVVTPWSVVTHPVPKHVTAAHVAAGRSRLTPHRLATRVRGR